MTTSPVVRGKTLARAIPQQSHSASFVSFRLQTLAAATKTIQKAAASCLWRFRHPRPVLHCVFLLAGLIVAGTIGAQQQPASNQEPTIRIQVQQVLVPVIVTDRKGHSVTDLKASDFQVFEDGSEERLSDFRTEQTGASELFEAGVSPQSRTGQSINLSPATGKSLPKFAYLIVVDTLYTAFEDFTYVRGALRKLFKEEHDPDSQYALVALGRTNLVLRDFTRDPEAVLAALGNKQTMKAIQSSEASNLIKQETQLLQDLMHHGCSTGLQSASLAGIQASTPSGSPKGSPKGSAKGTQQSNAAAEPSESCAFVLSEANADARERDVLTRTFLGDLRNLTEQLSSMPGRRVVVMASDGFNLQPGRELFELLAAATSTPSILLRAPTDYVTNEMNAIVSLATARNVTFYTVDSRGLYVVPPGGYDITGPPMGPSPVIERQKTLSAAEQDDPLRELAEDTGGLFFGGSNDLLGGLRRAFEDGRQYYLLAYYSSNRAADGKFRTITVHVKDKNLVVRHKPGYWGPLTSTAAAAATRAEPFAPASVPAAPASTGNIPAVPQPNHSELSFTGVRAPSLLEIPASEVARVVPDLKTLQPAASQDLLPSILQKVGANVATFFETFPNISCREKVVEVRQIPLKKLEDETIQDFNYLALTTADPKVVAFEEYRTDSKGRVVNRSGLDPRYVITEGFVSMPLNFHPLYQPYSKFRYLGQEEIGKRTTYVVAFAQRAFSPLSVLLAVYGARPLRVLSQGVAWIDPATDEIVRMWTGLEASLPAIKIRSQTTLVQFAEVRFKGMASSLSLPREVQVETRFTDATFKNIHSYSEFKHFTVQASQVAPQKDLR
jgi:VWFA-related protein